MAQLYIAKYKPRKGNYVHWALFLDERSDDTIFEVSGEHPKFTANTIKAKPEDSRSHARNILVGIINAPEIEQLKTQMASMPIGNETTEWNCQDYCIEAIDKLFEECIIDENDQDYKKGRKRAVSM